MTNFILPAAQLQPNIAPRRKSPPLITTFRFDLVSRATITLSGDTRPLAPLTVEAGPGDESSPRLLVLLPHKELNGSQGRYYLSYGTIRTTVHLCTSIYDLLEHIAFASTQPERFGVIIHKTGLPVEEEAAVSAFIDSYRGLIFVQATHLTVESRDEMILRVDQDNYARTAFQAFLDAFERHFGAEHFTDPMKSFQPEENMYAGSDGPQHGGRVWPHF